jgi:hypothetical protein
MAEMTEQQKANAYAILGVSAAVIWAANILYSMAKMEPWQ